MLIRPAEINDAEALLHIYSQYINTPITFEYELPSIPEFTERIRSTGAAYPYLVCEEEGRVLGYAYAHPRGERAAYQWNAELSVYLDASYTSRGLGKKLYHILIGILKLQGVRTVYGAVTLPNEKSEGLHASLGFKRLGTYHNTGYKSGAWHDVTWFEKQIAPYTPDPAPLLPIGSVSMEAIQAIIDEYMRAV